MADAPFWVREGFEQLKVGWLLYLSTSELNRPEPALRYFEATLLPGAKRLVDQLAGRPATPFPKPEQWDQWTTRYVSRWKGTASPATAARLSDYESYLSDYLLEIASPSSPARAATAPPAGLPRITDLAPDVRQIAENRLQIAAALAEWNRAYGDIKFRAWSGPKLDLMSQAKVVRAECDSAVSGIRTRLGGRAFPLPILRWEPAEARNLKRMARLVDRCSTVIGQLVKLGEKTPHEIRSAPLPNSSASSRLESHLDQMEGWPCWTLANNGGIGSGELNGLSWELDAAYAELQRALADSDLRKSLTDEVVVRLLMILTLLYKSDARDVPYFPCVSRLLEGTNWKGQVDRAGYSRHAVARTGFSLISRDGSTFVIRTRHDDEAPSATHRDDAREALYQAWDLVHSLFMVVGDNAEMKTIFNEFQPIHPDLFMSFKGRSSSEPQSIVSAPKVANLPEDLIAWRDLPALEASVPAASGLSQWHVLIQKLPTSLKEVREREASLRATFAAWMQTEEARPWFDSAPEAWKNVLILKQWIRLIPETDAEGNAWWPRGVSTIRAGKVIWKLREPQADKRKRIEAKGTTTPFVERAEGTYNAGSRTHAPVVNAAEAVLGKALGVGKILDSPSLESAERLLRECLDAHVNETTLVDPFKSSEPLFASLNGLVAKRPPSEYLKPLDDLLQALRDWCAIQGLWITPRSWTFEAGIPAEGIEALPARYDENSDRGTMVVEALGLAWQAPERKPPGLPEARAFRSAGSPPEYLDQLETALRDWKPGASKPFLLRIHAWPRDEWVGGGQIERTAVKFFTDFRDVNDKSDAYHKVEEALGRLLSARFGLDIFYPESLTEFGPRTANVRNSRTSHRSEIREVICPGLRLGDEVWVPAEVDVYE